MKQYFTVSEVAAEFGVTTATVYGWVNRGIVECRDTERPKVTLRRIPASEVMRLREATSQGLPLTSVVHRETPEPIVEPPLESAGIIDAFPETARIITAPEEVNDEWA